MRTDCLARPCSPITFNQELWTSTRFRVIVPPFVDRRWGIWGSYYNIPKAIFYLLLEDYKGLGFRILKPKPSKPIPFWRLGLDQEEGVGGSFATSG